MLFDHRMKHREILCPKSLRNVLQLYGIIKIALEHGRFQDCIRLSVLSALGSNTNFVIKRIYIQHTDEMARKEYVKYRKGIASLEFCCFLQFFSCPTNLTERSRCFNEMLKPSKKITCNACS